MEKKIGRVLCFDVFEILTLFNKKKSSLYETLNTAPVIVIG